MFSDWKVIKVCEQPERIGQVSRHQSLNEMRAGPGRAPLNQSAPAVPDLADGLEPILLHVRKIASCFKFHHGVLYEADDPKCKQELTGRLQVSQ